MLHSLGSDLDFVRGGGFPAGPSGRLQNRDVYRGWDGSVFVGLAARWTAAEVCGVGILDPRPVDTTDLEGSRARQRPADRFGLDPEDRHRDGVARRLGGALAAHPMAHSARQPRHHIRWGLCRACAPSAHQRSRGGHGCSVWVYLALVPDRTRAGLVDGCPAIDDACWPLGASHELLGQPALSGFDPRACCAHHVSVDETLERLSRAQRICGAPTGHASLRFATGAPRRGPVGRRNPVALLRRCVCRRRRYRCAEASSHRQSSAFLAEPCPSILVGARRGDRSRALGRLVLSSLRFRDLGPNQHRFDSIRSATSPTTSERLRQPVHLGRGAHKILGSDCTRHLVCDRCDQRGGGRRILGAHRNTGDQTATVRMVGCACHHCVCHRHCDTSRSDTRWRACRTGAALTLRLLLFAGGFSNSGTAPQTGSDRRGRGAVVAARGIPRVSADVPKPK